MQEEDARFLKRFVFQFFVSFHLFCRIPIIKIALLLKSNNSRLSEMVKDLHLRNDIVEI